MQQVDSVERAQLPVLSEYDPDVAAMIRREVENGAQLMARWNADLAGDVAAGETQVDVVPLPFPS